MTKPFRILTILITSGLLALSIGGCTSKDREKITDLQQLNDKEFGVPTGSVADKLVLSKFADAKFQYFNSVLD